MLFFTHLLSCNEEGYKREKTLSDGRGDKGEKVLLKGNDGYCSGGTREALFCRKKVFLRRGKS